MNEQQLSHNLHTITEHDVPHKDVWPAIQQRVKPHQRTARFRPMRLVVTLAALVIVGVAVFSTPARTWAQDVVDDVLTRFGFVRTPFAQPTLEEVTAPPPADMRPFTAQCANGFTIIGTTSDPNGYNGTYTRANIQAQVQYPLKLPTDLPDYYCILDELYMVPEHQLVGWWITPVPELVSWHVVRPDKCQTSLTTFFWQMPANLPFPNDVDVNTIGAAPTQEVTVNGSAGLWIEDAPSGVHVLSDVPEELEELFDANASSAPPASIPADVGDEPVEEFVDSDAPGEEIASTPTGLCTYNKNVLTWEQDGIRYRLRAPFALDEMLKIAASIK